MKRTTNKELLKEGKPFPSAGVVQVCMEHTVMHSQAVFIHFAVSCAAAHPQESKLQDKKNKVSAEIAPFCLLHVRLVAAVAFSFLS